MRPDKLAVDRRIILGLWMVSILMVIIGSLAPADTKLMKLVDDLNISDKLQHFGAYVILAVLPVLGRRRMSQGCYLGASMAVLGVGLELAQSFSPGRTPDVYDAVADFGGVLTGLALGWASRNYLNLKATG